jgi:hypothetical protein
VEKVEKFVTAIGGKLNSWPIADGTPQGAAAVSNAIADSLSDEIRKYEESVKAIQTDSTDKALERAWASVNSASEKITRLRQFLGCHETILEDHLALVTKLLTDRQAAREAAAKSGIVLVM